jgi:hypothetical protein
MSINWALGISAVQAIGLLLGVVAVTLIEPRTTEGAVLLVLISVLLANVVASVVRFLYNWFGTRNRSAPQ